LCDQAEGEVWQHNVVSIQIAQQNVPQGNATADFSRHSELSSAVLCHTGMPMKKKALMLAKVFACSLALLTSAGYHQVAAPQGLETQSIDFGRWICQYACSVKTCVVSGNVGIIDLIMIMAGGRQVCLHVQNNSQMHYVD
jgi:hypothetical protein